MKINRRLPATAVVAGQMGSRSLRRILSWRARITPVGSANEDLLVDSFLLSVFNDLGDRSDLDHYAGDGREKRPRKQRIAQRPFWPAGGVFPAHVGGREQLAVVVLIHLAEETPDACERLTQEEFRR